MEAKFKTEIVQLSTVAEDATEDIYVANIDKLKQLEIRIRNAKIQKIRALGESDSKLKSDGVKTELLKSVDDAIVTLSNKILSKFYTEVELDYNMLENQICLLDTYNPDLEYFVLEQGKHTLLNAGKYITFTKTERRASNDAGNFIIKFSNGTEHNAFLRTNIDDFGKKLTEQKICSFFLRKNDYANREITKDQLIDYKLMAECLKSIKSVTAQTEYATIVAVFKEQVEKERTETNAYKDKLVELEYYLKTASDKETRVGDPQFETLESRMEYIESIKQRIVKFKPRLETQQNKFKQLEDKLEEMESKLETITNVVSEMPKEIQSYNGKNSILNKLKNKGELTEDETAQLEKATRAINELDKIKSSSPSTSGGKTKKRNAPRKKSKKSRHNRRSTKGKR